jgi:hypothetical protein
MFSSSGEVWQTPALLRPLERANLNYWTTLALSNGPKRIGVSHHSPEEEERSSFRNVVFCVF